MTDHLDSNQTQFAELTPILETGAVRPATPTAASAATPETPRPKSKRPIIVGVIGVVLLVVFLLLLVLIRMALPGTQPAPTDDQSQIDQLNGEIDPLLNEIYLLDEQLQASDPAVDSVPFPPVDLTIRLDPKKR